LLLYRITTQGEVHVPQLATSQPDLECVLDAGSPIALRSTQQLFKSLYQDLHRLAKRQVARQHSSQAVGATTLLHEVYLDISERAGPSFPDDARFMAYAARSMRGLIIDFARQRRAQKRGGSSEITSLNENTPLPRVEDRDLLQIGAAVDELAALDPQLAQVVDLKFFCGFSFEDIAAMRGVCKRTVQRDWERARLHLYRSLNAVAGPHVA
jgi:RNA polymerase sigma factor (TIGR02999 family)